MQDFAPSSVYMNRRPRCAAALLPQQTKQKIKKTKITKMKKSLLLLLPCLALGLFTACGDSSYEVHNTYFYPVQASGVRVYADQPTDTIHLISLDSWTATSSVDWMTVTPASFTATGSFNDTRLTMNFEDNNTGEVRYGYIQVDSYATLGKLVFQYPWLNITRPSAVYYTEDITESDSQMATFYMNLDAAAADTLVAFTVYQDGATLQSDAAWAVPDSTTFSAGSHSIGLTIAANETDSARTAKLTLTSGTVSTTITLNQAVEEE